MPTLSATQQVQLLSLAAELLKLWTQLLQSQVAQIIVFELCRIAEVLVLDFLLSLSILSPTKAGQLSDAIKTI